MACLKTHVWGYKTVQDVKANSQLVTMSAIFRLLAFCKVVIRLVWTTRNSAVLIRLGDGSQRDRGIKGCYFPVSVSVRIIHCRTYGGPMCAAAAANPRRIHLAAHEADVHYFRHFLQGPTAAAPTERDDLRQDKCQRCSANWVTSSPSNPRGFSTVCATLEGPENMGV
jgi:hypothetical protein